MADVYEAAGVLRRQGERTAATEGRTQARWQVLSVISDGDWTAPIGGRPIRGRVVRQFDSRFANELADEGLVAFGESPRNQRSPVPAAHAPVAVPSSDAITKRSRSQHRALLNDLSDVDVDNLRHALRRVSASSPLPALGSISSGMDDRGFGVTWPMVAVPPGTSSGSAVGRLWRLSDLRVGQGEDGSEFSSLGRMPKVRGVLTLKRIAQGPLRT